MLILRPYDQTSDEAHAYALWQRALGDQWPISRAAFADKTTLDLGYQPGDHFVAEIEGRIAGFVATHRDLQLESRRGGIKVILVDPNYQRQGVGRVLLEHACSFLKGHGISEVRLGSGGASYFWPGVPINLPGAWAFFQACGWEEHERTFDLIRSLSDYVTPVGIFERLLPAQITIANAASQDVASVLAFEAEHFPGWLPYYQQMVDHGDVADIVLALDVHHAIVGAAIITDQAWCEHDIPWKQMLGAQTGGLGVLGVAEAWRDHGIGLALAARVTEQLRDRGLATSFVGYTWLPDWYGRLGYQIWREYRIGWKQI